MPFDAAGLIRRTRVQAGLTQAALAARAGTTQTAIARVERAGSNPRVQTLERLLDAAGVRFSLVAQPPVPAVDEQQLAHYLRLAPAERAARHEAAYAELAAFAQGARRVDG